MQIKSGSVSVTNGSQVVTGIDTVWMNRVNVGDSFIVAGIPVFYTIASVDSNTQITLSVPYAGTSQSDITYAISQDFTPINGLPEISTGDIEVAATFTRAMRKIDQQLSLSQDAGAITAAGVHPDTASGTAGTTNGDYFFVPEADEFVLYVNSSGTAVEQLRFASLATVLQYAQDASQAATDAQNSASGAAQTLADVQQLETDFDAVLTGAQQAVSSAEGSAFVANQSAQDAQASEQSAEQDAVTATEQADRSEQEADRSEQEADRAEAAADSVLLSQGIFPDTATGLNQTGDGDYFSTPSNDGNEYLILYRNDAGSAVQIAEYPSRQGIDAFIQDVNDLVGTRVFFTTSQAYTLPDTPTDDSDKTQIFTKIDSVAPIINSAGSDVIRYFGQNDTTLEYDLNVVVTLVYNSGVWTVLHD